VAGRVAVAAGEGMAERQLGVAGEPLDIGCGSSAGISPTAESPGPPAKKTTGSGARPGPVAGMTANRTGMVRPWPVSRSSGTISVPHRAILPSA